MQKDRLENCFIDSIVMTASLMESYSHYLENIEIDKVSPSRLFLLNDFCGVEFDAVTFIRKLI